MNMFTVVGLLVSLVKNKIKSNPENYIVTRLSFC